MCASRSLLRPSRPLPVSPVQLNVGLQDLTLHPCSKYIKTVTVHTVSRVKRSFMMAIGFLRASAHSIFQRIKPIVEWIFKNAALIAASGSMIFAGWQAILLKKQIELENRPFVSIENPYWWYHRDENKSVWLGIGFDRSNYGQRFAEEVEFRNFRAITVAIDEKRLTEKIERRTSQGLKQYLAEYVADERNRLVLRLMSVLSRYFRTHPDTDKLALEAFVASLSPESPTLQGDGIFFYDGRLLFSPVEVNNEMQEYLKSQRGFVLPNRLPQKGQITLQMESANADVLDGQNLLIVFLAVHYQSALRDMDYSTFFLGYSGRNIGKKIQDRDGAFLAEFQSWSSEE